jgi:hypothetical protein
MDRRHPGASFPAVARDPRRRATAPLARFLISQTRAQILTYSQAFTLALELVTAKQRKGYDLIEQPDLRMLAAPPLTAPQYLHTSAPEPMLPFARKLRL